MMQRVIEESVCDRCGKTYKTEPDWKPRGGALLGKIYDLIPYLSDDYKDRDYNTHVRLYYVSHMRYIGGQPDKVVDLCDECKDELSKWFNTPRLERDE